MEINEYESENKKDAKVGGSSKINRDFFYKAVFELSKYSGYEFDIDNRSALEFAIRYASMMDYYASVNNQSKKK